MNIVDFRYRFQLDYNQIIDNKIKSKTAIDFDSLVNHRQRFLSFKWNALQRKLMRQTAFICRFQKAGTESAMYFDSCTYDLAGKYILRLFHKIFLPFAFPLRSWRSLRFKTG